VKKMKKMKKYFYCCVVFLRYCVHAGKPLSLFSFFSLVQNIKRAVKPLSLFSFFSLVQNTSEHSHTLSLFSLFSLVPK